MDRRNGLCHLVPRDRIDHVIVEATKLAGLRFLPVVDERPAAGGDDQHADAPDDDRDALLIPMTLVRAMIAAIIAVTTDQRIPARLLS